MKEEKILKGGGVMKKLVYFLMVGLAFTAYQVAMVEAQGKPKQDKRLT